MTMEKLGGMATLGQINQHLFDIKDCEWKTKTPFASVRRIVRHTQGIYRIKPGLYGLESCRKKLEANGFVVETEENKTSKAVRDFNHSYYQGLLLEMGNMRNMDTFVPNQDKGRRYTEQLTLGQLRNLDDIPKFSYTKLVDRSSTIDVIWFLKRFRELDMPSVFFEVENTTDMQNSLLKFVDLQDFNVRMVIVADEVRKNEFNSKMLETGFEDIYDRVEFLSYASLLKQYNQDIDRSMLNVVL